MFLHDILAIGLFRITKTHLIDPLDKYAPGRLFKEQVSNRRFFIPNAPDKIYSRYKGDALRKREPLQVLNLIEYYENV